MFVKLRGLPDPRVQGSGNLGATNVMRIAGKKPAIITLAIDVLRHYFSCAGTIP
nr:glycerol-3-phosphate acyltransferase [Methyloprofundus sedimenti]